MKEKAAYLLFVFACWDGEFDSYSVPVEGCCRLWEFLGAEASLYILSWVRRMGG